MQSNHRLPSILSGKATCVAQWHATLNRTLSKALAESTTSSAAPLLCWASFFSHRFHLKEQFPLHSFGSTNKLRASIPRAAKPDIPLSHTRGPWSLPQPDESWTDAIGRSLVTLLRMRKKSVVQPLASFFFYCQLQLVEQGQNFFTPLVCEIQRHPRMEAIRSNSGADLKSSIHPPTNTSRSGKASSSLRRSSSSHGSYRSCTSSPACQCLHHSSNLVQFQAPSTASSSSVLKNVAPIVMPI